MSKRDRERAEKGLLFRNGRLVPKEQVEKTVQRPKVTGGRPVVPSYSCSICGEPAIAVVGKKFYCKTHLEELAAQAKKETGNGEEDSKAVHDADTSGGDEHGEAPGAGGDSKGSKRTRKQDAR